MREIKFRAWNKQYKEIREVRIIDFFHKIGRKIEPLLTMKSHIKGVEFGMEGLIRHFILMQFTGLKDKNGKEIFEGDIVRRPLFKTKHQILWVKVLTPFGLAFETDTGRATNAVHITNLNKVEIIGNIYENPELLEESK